LASRLRFDYLPDYFILLRIGVRHLGWHSVASSEGQQAVCLLAMVISLRVFSAHPARQHRLSVFLAMGVCSSGLIEQGCLTSFCVISCWQSVTGSDRDSDSEMCNMRLCFSVVQHCSVLN